MNTMTLLNFNPLAYAKKLESAGFTKEQAETAAEVQNEAIQCTIEYVKANEFAGKQDLSTTQITIQKEIEILRKDIEVVKSDLKRDIADSKAELVRWVVGAGFLQITLITVLVMLLLKLSK